MKHEGTTLVRTQGFPKRTDAPCILHSSVSTGVGAVYVLHPWRNSGGMFVDGKLVAMNINREYATMWWMDTPMGFCCPPKDLTNSDSYSGQVCH